jgi:DNA-binding LacI/PurR family transcriptional regulator
MPATLKDVAKLANVSPVVVSRVLHNKANGVRVSEATAERVRKAAEELNYKVNVWARNFRAQRTKMIGVLNGQGTFRPRFSRGPRYFATIMDGIVDGAFEHDYSVAMCPQLLGENAGDAVGDGRFDGFVWYSIAASETNISILQASAAPIVILHAHSHDYGGKHPTIICDNYQGIGLGVDHLVELGHRRIAFAYESDAMNVETLARMYAFRKHMARHGLHVSEADILDVHADREALRRYLSNSRPHSAIVVHADGLAGDMLEEAPRFGLSIPDDLSVIGFDSTEFCDQFRPGLTSIAQPLFDMGSKAIDLLMKALGDNAQEPLELVLPCKLDVRGSTGRVVQTLN